MKLQKVNHVGALVLVTPRDCAVMARACDAALGSVVGADQEDEVRELEANQAFFQALGMAAMTLSALPADAGAAWHCELGQLLDGELGQLVELRP